MGILNMGDGPTRTVVGMYGSKKEEVQRWYVGAVDADTIFYRVGFAVQNNELVHEDDILSETLDAMDAFIYKIKEACQCDNYVFFISGSDNFRYEEAYSKPYKGNRSEAGRPMYLNEMKEYIMDKYDAISCHGYEADDAVIAMSDMYGEHCIVMSQDKDLRQQQGHHYDYVKGEFIYITQDEGIKNLWKQVITGDSTDNIPGLYRIGDKKAEAYLSSYDVPEYPMAVWSLYKSKGHGFSYFREQYVLVKMKKEILIDKLEIFENFKQFMFEDNEEFSFDE
jgi:5'-3' exonuclease